MTSIPLLGLGDETPVEGQPLLTVNVVTDEMGRSALSPLESLKRDFYCRCICDPLNKLRRKIPMSAVKVALLCMAAIVILVCLTILEVVGAHRQGLLQHALKERLKYRNFTEDTLNWVLQHRAAASVIGQYGHRILAPYTHGTSTDNGSNSTDASNSTLVGGNETTQAPSKLLNTLGLEKVHLKVLDKVDKASNYTEQVSSKIRDALT